MVRTSARSLAVVVGAIFGILAIGWSVTLTSAVQLLAVTVLAMGGTQHPLVDGQGGWADDPAFVSAYVDDAIRVYVAPSGAVRGDPADAEYAGVAVHTPEEFGPVFGTKTFDDSVAAGTDNLDKCVHGSAQCVSHTMTGDPQPGAPIVVYGYSQSAVIATIEKRKLIEQYNETGEAPDVTFVLLANPNRPNGGVLQRFDGFHIPMLDVTFSGSTPTDSEFTTVDIARQYDGWADFPAYPVNMAATANALLGIYYLHGDYWSDDVGAPLEQGQVGDTTYYLIPTERLPLLMPLHQLGVPTPLLTAMDAPLRVIVEFGYDRDPDHVGTRTRAGLIPLINPITGVTSLVLAIPTGLDDGLAEASADPQFRPLGTSAATSPYGVGGVELGDPMPSPEPITTTASSESTEVAPIETPVAERNSGTQPVPVQPVLDRPRTNILRNLVPPRGDTSSEAPAVERRPLKRLLTRLTGPREETQGPAAATGGGDPEPAAHSDPDAA
ncbi:PE-PPE domain-containing protein [Mycolicibacterium baixiangningiae]|uniref:PE-PPE domain-containing protein n=1 Tax=Mycolicibacterium baixiangningiae TaxID=2761578 RepID=UPI00186767CB|nr:PE-PPE domain-containing protein [Mycolicibacterium baixiangningiae]